MMRVVTVEELSGFRAALLDLCIAIDLKDYDPIDLCGTGGDGKDTFNISTLASFVTAGAGVAVAKHGNYGVSSSCGSSNVMEHLGIRFSNDQDFLRNCIEKSGICVLHAPLFHPAMKHVAPIRRDRDSKPFSICSTTCESIKTKQANGGCFQSGITADLSPLEETNQQYSILHALDGYDEISSQGIPKWYTTVELQRLMLPLFQSKNCKRIKLVGANR